MRIVILGEDELQSGILTVKDFFHRITNKVARAELDAHSPSTQASKGPLVAKDSVVLDFLGSLERTHLCGDLRAATRPASGADGLGQPTPRPRQPDFLDLRDRSGISQIVLDKELTPDGHAKGEQVRPDMSSLSSARYAYGTKMPSIQNGNRRD